MIFHRQEGVGAAIALLNRLVEESILANTQEWSNSTWFSKGKVRDIKGLVVRMAAQPCSCTNAHEAQAMALDWA